MWARRNGRLVLAIAAAAVIALLILIARNDEAPPHTVALVDGVDPLSIGAQAPNPPAAGPAPVPPVILTRPLARGRASAPDTIRVFVIDEQSRRPVPNAEVAWTEDVIDDGEIAAQSSDAALAGGFDAAPNKTKTDAGGRVSVPAFDHMTIAARSEDRFGILVLDEKPRGEIRLAVSTGPMIKARVIDADGSPAHGVPVMFWFNAEQGSDSGSKSSVFMVQRAVSRAPDGVAVLGPWNGVSRDLPAPATITASVQLPFEDGPKAKASSEEFPAEGLTLALPQSARLEVQLVDPAGRTPPGRARVCVGTRHGLAIAGTHPARGTMVTSESGRFTFPYLPAGALLRVAAFSDDFDAVVADVPQLAGAQNRIEVRFERRRAQVFGRVVDADGAGIAHTDLEVRFHRTLSDREDYSIHAPELRSVRTDGDGTFRLREDRAVFFDGHCELELRGREVDISGAVMAPPCNPDGDTDLGSILLTPSLVLLNGRVVDDEGMPVAGARVVAGVSGGVRGVVSFSMHARRREAGGRFGRYRAVSDPDGAFRIPRAAHAKEPREWVRSLTVAVHKDGFVQRNVHASWEPGAADAEVVLQRAGSIEGSIVVDDRVPAASVTIHVVREGATTTAHADRVDSDGTFALPAVAAGIVELSFVIGGATSPSLTVPGIAVLPHEVTRDARLTGLRLQAR